jgi:hypothetical protein
MQFETAEYDALMSVLRDEVDFQSTWGTGRRMTTPQVMDLALDVTHD